MNSAGIPTPTTWAEAVKAAATAPVMNIALLRIAADADYVQYIRDVVKAGVHRNELQRMLLSQWQAPILTQDPELIAKALHSAEASNFVMRMLMHHRMRSDLKGAFGGDKSKLTIDDISEMASLLSRYKTACREVDENRHDLESAFGTLAAPAAEQWDDINSSLDIAEAINRFLISHDTAADIANLRHRLISEISTES